MEKILSKDERAEKELSQLSPHEMCPTCHEENVYFLGQIGTQRRFECLECGQYFRHDELPTGETICITYSLPKEGR